MTAETLNALLSVLRDHAKGLQDAGVAYFEIDSLKVQLSPTLDLKGLGSSSEQSTHDPLSDPDTYGMGSVPGFLRLRNSDED